MRLTAPLIAVERRNPERWQNAVPSPRMTSGSQWKLGRMAVRLADDCGAEVGTCCDQHAAGTARPNSPIQTAWPQSSSVCSHHGASLAGTPVSQGTVNEAPPCPRNAQTRHVQSFLSRAMARRLWSSRFVWRCAGPKDPGKFRRPPILFFFQGSAVSCVIPSDMKTVACFFSLFYFPSTSWPRMPQPSARNATSSTNAACGATR